MDSSQGAAQRNELEDWLRRNLAGPLYTACIQAAVTMSENDDSLEPLQCLQIVIGGIIHIVTAEVERCGDDDLAKEISSRYEQTGPSLH